jgi:molecular chaperone DnaJ
MDIFREVFGAMPGNIFDEIFGGGRSDPSQAQRGADLRYDLEISLIEAANGCEREVTFNRQERCESCHGSGAEPGGKLRACSACGGRGQVVTSRGIFSLAQTCPRCEGLGQTIDKPCLRCLGAGRREKTAKIKIRIPPGVDTGARLRSSGNGDSGFRGGSPGDLYVVLHVKEHEIFQREGDDLICDVPVSFVQAALGADIEVPTLSGNAQIKIPPGTQHGTTFRLRGKGIRNLQGYSTGDLLVRVGIEVPTRLNSAQKAKLQEFAALCDENVNPIARSFFEKAKSFFS